jgi:hypothetical protein
VPTRLRNIRCTAEREPHFSRLHAGRECLFRGPVAELGYHEIAVHDPAVRGTELIGNSLPVLAQSHFILPLVGLDPIDAGHAVHGRTAPARAGNAKGPRPPKRNTALLFDEY